MSATVLLVEDEILLQESIAVVLTEAGFSPLQACDGQEAMAKIAAHADHIDALITDIELGAGPTGWQIARIARNFRPRLPIIYMSGDCLHEWPRQGVAGSTFLPKPFRLSRLLDHLELRLCEEQARLLRTAIIHTETRPN